MHLTLATWLTVARIAAVPVLVVLILLQATGADGSSLRWATLAIFAAAALTDFLDGYLARSRNEITALGRCLDSIADKLLVAAVLVCLVAVDRAPVIATVIILSRELLISGLREVVAGLPKTAGAAPLPVTWVAKWKTTVQMVALALLLVGDLPGLPLALPGAILLWIGAGLSVWSGGAYLRQGLGQLAASDREAAAPPTAAAQGRKIT